MPTTPTDRDRQVPVMTPQQAELAALLAGKSPDERRALALAWVQSGV